MLCFNVLILLVAPVSSLELYSFKDYYLYILFWFENLICLFISDLTAEFRGYFKSYLFSFVKYSFDDIPAASPSTINLLLIFPLLS